MTSATSHPPPTPTPQEVRMKLAIPDISPDEARSPRRSSHPETEEIGRAPASDDDQVPAQSSPRSKSRSLHNGVSSLMRIAMPSHRPIVTSGSARDKNTLQSIAENYPQTPALEPDAHEVESDDEEPFSPEAESGVSQETTVHSGYLMKKGERRKTWKKRWFVLRSSKLAYYKSDKEYRLLRLMNMADVRTITPIPYKYENVFGIVTTGRTYYMQANSAKDMDQWITALHQVKDSLGHTSTDDREDASTTGGHDTDRTAPRSAEDETSSNHLRSQPINIASRGGTTESRNSTARNASSSPPVSRNANSKAVPRSYASQSTNTTSTSFVGEQVPVKGIDYFGASGTAANGEYNNSHYGASASTSASASRYPSAGTSITSPPSTALASGATTPQYGTGARGGVPPPPPPNSLSASYAQTAGPIMRSVGQAPSLNQITGDWVEEDGGQSRHGLSSPVEDYFNSERPARAGGETSPRYPTSPSFNDRADQVGSSSDEDDDGSDGDEDGTVGGAAPTTPGDRTLGVLPNEGSYDQDKVVKKGYLMKQGKRKNWRKRWFVLTQHRLMYFKSDKERKLHRQIMVTKIVDAIEYEPKIEVQGRANSGPQHQHGFASVFNAVGTPAAPSQAGSSQHAHPDSATSHPGVAGGSTDPHKRKQFCIKIITPKRTYLVGAPSEEDEIHWLSALQAVLARQRSAGTGQHRLSAVSPILSHQNLASSPPSSPQKADVNKAMTSQSASNYTKSPTIRVTDAPTTSRSSSIEGLAAHPTSSHALNPVNDESTPRRGSNPIQSGSALDIENLRLDTADRTDS